MRLRSRNILAALVATLLCPPATPAEQVGKSPDDASHESDSVISGSMRGCKEDISRHCAGLARNATKAFMCLMAYEEQLSPVCRKGVLEAAVSIKAGSEAIDYSLHACEADVDAYCRNVPPGEGRVIGCIKANESRVSSGCMAALKETGIWEGAR